MRNRLSIPSIYRTVFCGVVFALRVLDCAALAPQPPMDAESFAFEGGTIVLDKQLLEHRDWVKALIEEEVGRAKQRGAVNHLTIHKKVRQIVDAAFDLAGLEKQGELYESILEKRAEKMIKAESPAYVIPDEFTVYVLTTKTAKDFMRQGGKLPFCRYDANRDIVSFAIGIDFGQSEVPLPRVLIVHGLPGAEEEPFTKEGLGKMLRLYFDSKSMTDEFLDSLHENADDPDQSALQMSLMFCAANTWSQILRRYKHLANDDHTSWFTSGLTNALVNQTLRDLGEAEVADNWQHLIFGVDEQGEVFQITPNDRAYLRFWNNRISIEPRTSDYYDTFIDYRAAAATSELQRLLDHLTVQRLPELIRLIADERIDTTAKLEAEIKAQLGYDIGARLDLYQPEGTPQDLYNAVIAKAIKSRDAGEQSDALRQLMLAHELQAGKAVKDLPQVYRMIFDLAEQFQGEEEMLIDIVHAWWVVIHRQDEPADPATREALATRWLAQALRVQKPSRAYPLLKALDKQAVVIEPAVNAQAFEQFIRLVRANQLVDQNQIKEAQELIDLAIEAFPTEVDPSFKEHLLLPNAELIQLRIDSRKPALDVFGRLPGIEHMPDPTSPIRRAS